MPTFTHPSKIISTSRGLKYNCYFHASSDPNKPTLLFLHGFPTAAYGWRHQLSFFAQQGYGFLAPDLLGYGGTDGPTDPTLYARSAIAKDIIDILDAENLHKVIAIGHDWGSRIAGRLAELYADRFIAFAFLVVAYSPPNPVLKYEDLLAFTKNLAGYELFGYWSFFSADGADKLCEKNFDSLFSLFFTEDTSLWIENVCKTGGLKAWMEADKKAPLAPYISKEEIEKQKEVLLKPGLAGAFCWYKIITSTIDLEDSKTISPEKWVIHKPVFYAGAKKDPIVPPAFGNAIIAKHCLNATTKEFDTGHWVIWEAKDELNNALEEWIHGL